MTFLEAVQSTPGLEEAGCNGLQAMKAADREHVKAQTTRRLKGSVDVDCAMREAHPNANRWDYGVGHAPTNVEGEVVYWIEIHPATDGEIKFVLAKLQWLKGWLKGSAPNLSAMLRRYIWVSSGKTSFTLSAPQRKQLALQGLEHKGSVFTIPDEF
jgi:hypothetical protein